jgi:hypothetical protein
MGVVNEKRCKNFDIGLYRKSTKTLNPISLDNFNKVIVPLIKSTNPGIILLS